MSQIKLGLSTISFSFNTSFSYLAQPLTVARERLADKTAPEYWEKNQDVLVRLLKV